MEQTKNQSQKQDRQQAKNGKPCRSCPGGKGAEDKQDLR